MSTIVIRFPDGTREYLYKGRDVTTGDRIWHDGEHWRVLAVSSNDGRPQTATVERDSDGLTDVSLGEGRDRAWTAPRSVRCALKRGTPDESGVPRTTLTHDQAAGDRPVVCDVGYATLRIGRNAIFVPCCPPVCQDAGGGLASR